MNEELKKRVKSGSWIVLAGFVVTALSLLIERLDVFQLTEVEKTLLFVVGTALVSQITKWLNTK